MNDDSGRAETTVRRSPRPEVSAPFVLRWGDLRPLRCRNISGCEVSTAVGHAEAIGAAGVGTMSPRTAYRRRNVLPKASEKAEQAAIVDLLRAIGSEVYVLGTRRPKGDYPGTRQTPGLPDVLAFLPARSRRNGEPRMQLWVEVKACGGKLRPEQIVFRDLCLDADVPHVVGGIDAVTEWLISQRFLSREHVPYVRRDARPTRPA